ncbi:hypothetical protein C8F04DRAFT_62062 [Mycena alexandri]|uniref:Uncharacterized protein n=1 Tax=Mycena alexandri TaxID=1745969 RepID=A0AAD6WYU8_9AGAR|nr:hypothetical protein C8F04DRAFT_62062 [Mycena alexandri]
MLPSEEWHTLKPLFDRREMSAFPPARTKGSQRGGRHPKAWGTGEMASRGRWAGEQRTTRAENMRVMADQTSDNIDLASPRHLLSRRRSTLALQESTPRHPSHPRLGPVPLDLKHTTRLRRKLTWIRDLFWSTGLRLQTADKKGAQNCCWRLYRRSRWASRAISLVGEPGSSPWTRLLAVNFPLRYLMYLVRAASLKLQTRLLCKSDYSSRPRLCT